MNGALTWMARNHVAANLLMLIFVVGGLLVAPSIKQEIFPEVNLDRVQIQVAYPGASPDEVEDGIILQIEDRVSGIDGIREIQATAAEGIATVTAVIKDGENPDEILQDIKSEVDRITTFPEDAEKPVISKLVNRREVVSVVVYGQVGERALREQIQGVRDELLALPEITQVELSGVRPYEISVEIPEATLRKYRLTLDEIAARIRQGSLDLPAGALRAEGGEILIRTKEKRHTAAQYGDIVVIRRDDGTTVRLGELATVRDTFAETDTSATFNDRPAAMASVFRVGDEKPTDISRAVGRYIEEKRPTLPRSIGIDSWNDTSEVLQSRMDLLRKNALYGLVLVFLCLSMFLQIRLALWVMLGIPISFLGTLLLMPALSISINMIALFAFIMALGILVDDAIVVGEAIFEQRQQGKPLARAAIDGVHEVGVPVIFSVLTTVCAFVPLAHVSGSLGKFIKVIPLVVVTLLFVSLLESLFILPAHLSLGRRRRNEKPSIGERFRRRFVTGLDRFVNGFYRRALDLALRYRYVTIAFSVALLLLSVGVVRGGLIKFTFMPEVDGDLIICNLEMERGTPVAKTAEVETFLRQQGRRVVAEYDLGRGQDGSTLRKLYSIIGGTMAGGGPVGGGGNSGSHLANIALLLTPSEERGYPSADITRQWRQAAGEIPGVKTLTFSSNLMRLGANIDVQLSHRDFAAITAAADRIKTGLQQYPGISDIADNYPEGKMELKLRLTETGSALGITGESLGRQIRAAFYGAEAMRLQRGRNEVKVMVRYPPEERHQLRNLEGMRLRTPAGGEVPLLQAAAVDPGRGYSVITRNDLKRVINITGAVDSAKANAEEILDDLRRRVLPGLVADYPGLSWSMEGEQKERRDAMASMGRGFRLALFGIYVLLAIPLRSYSQPLLIMAAIPFGIVGAVLGHLLMGYDLSMLSIFGIVALSGVVVNDSLLLIDQANRNRIEGKNSLAAMSDAGIRRFRPILLTSITTFFGLLPMITETSVQAQFLIPMAISLAFGVLFATGITLALIPSLYLVLEDLRRLLGLQHSGAGQEEDEESGPAPRAA
ncbi:MAG: efflux RND transporter permease subunit [Thermodesulfobacteriota bacterium]